MHAGLRGARLVGLLGEFGAEHAAEEALFAAEVPLHLLLFHDSAVDGSVRATLQKVGVELKGKAAVATVDVTRHSEVGRFFGVAPSGSLRPPVLLAFSLANGTKFAHTAALEVAPIRSFAAAVAAGEVAPHLRSQPVPPPPGAPAERHQAHERALYREEIRAADAEIGRLIAHLQQRGLWDDLIVIFVTDHGESLRDRLEPSHGYYVFDETIRVPLTIKHPDLAPTRVEFPVSQVDVLPTLATLAGLEHRPRCDGIDLTPWMRGEQAEAPDRPIYFESLAPMTLHGGPEAPLRP